MSEVVNPVVGSTPTIELTIQDQDGNLVDLTDATATIILKAPNVAAVIKTGSFNTPATDGIVKYTCSTSDLSIPGDWQVQAHAIFADGPVYYSNIETFTVDPVLE